MADNGEKRYIPVKYTDTFEVEYDIEQRHPGIDIAPRTVENALRRGQLKFYQVGRKRYTTTELIDEWLAEPHYNREVSATPRTPQKPNKKCPAGFERPGGAHDLTGT